MNPLTQSKNTTILPVLMALTLGCFAFSPQARAACQEGCDTINLNTFLGENALINNTTGVDNTAVGYHALLSNTTGANNTALGKNALLNNTAGSANTAVGWNALNFNVVGGSNTAVGIGALNLNTSGSWNTAVGGNALESNSTGSFNTATGYGALLHARDASNNAAYGYQALHVNNRGSNNTGVGFQALWLNHGGDNNTCLGSSSLFNCKGDNNTAIGTGAGMNITSGNNNICIRNAGVGPESNAIRIGNETHTNTFIGGITGVTVPGGVGVIVDTNGHLGTVVSAARFKDEIKPMDEASEAILALKPVTFRYKKELDPEGIAQFGLVAEEVEKVNRDLVARDAEGKAYTVRYEAVNAMLLNEFIKEHRRVETLEATVERQQSVNAEQQQAIKALTASLKEQAAQIQKVSAELEASIRVQQTVVSNP